VSLCGLLATASGCSLTPLPSRTHCRLALDPFICDFPAFFDAADCAALCNFLNTSLPDGSSAFERDGSAADAVGVAVAVGKMQQWPRVHEFIHTRARFLMAENVTKSSDAATEPHVFVSRAPSRKRKRSPSRPITFTEFVLKKVNLGSEEAISQVLPASNTILVYAKPPLRFLNSCIAGGLGLWSFPP
jgi:hypothetical protein